MNDNLVYTLTFHEVLNVGAILQAYALQKFIADAGYETLVLNYRPWYFMWQVYRPTRNPLRAAAKYTALRKFRSFKRQNLHVSSRYFRDIEDLPRFDNCRAIVCGSDQIWNKQLTRGQYDQVFFLGCAMQAKKIAYGASSGGHTLSRDATLIKKLFSSFNAIGVREDFLREDLLTNDLVEDATTVVDPTFLISNYDALLDYRYLPDPPDYIVTYEVGSADSRFDLAAAALKLKKLFDLPILHIGAKPIDVADHSLPVLSPAEWLGVVSKATLVCTNSFHGASFALNMRRGLAFVPHRENEKNVRPFNLLDRTNLAHLIHTDENSLSCGHFTNYDTSSLDKEIAKSKAFLLDSLKH